MDTTELSPIARRRLWQCYLLLLELADQAEEEAVLDSELAENHDEELASKPDDNPQLDNDSLETDLNQDNSEDYKIDEAQ